MKAIVRWTFWVVALGSGAVLGIALAGGEGDARAWTPAECVARLSDPDWTIRAQATRALREGGQEAYDALFTVSNPHPEAQFRIVLLRKELAPLYGAWNDALEAGREALDEGRHPLALRYLLIAAEKNEPLRHDAWIADLCTRCWQALPENGRDLQARPDWHLFLVGEHGALADRFPESPLREKSLFLAARYREVIAEYPEGAYAPLARYSLTAGHPYFQPPRYLEIDDPGREAEEWPRFLRENPGHPGSDDAAYRLGRALELLGRYREAVLWLHRAARLPDGEFTWKGPLRAVYVMDALASEEELRALAEAGIPAEVREQARLTLAVRALRCARFVEARDAFASFLERYPQSPHREKVEARIREIEETLIPAAEALSVMAGRDEALYALGRYFYHRVLALYNPIWNGNRVNYFSYEVNALGRSHAFDNPDYFEAHNNYLRAASYFDLLAREHPESGLRAAALYSAATALFKAVNLNQFSAFHRTRAEVLEASRARYRRLEAEHPESSLADDAARMLRVLETHPTDGWR